MSSLGVVLVFARGETSWTECFREIDQPMTEDLIVTREDLWTVGDGKSRAERTVEILLTLSRFGFGELIERSWWARWLPDRPPEAERGVDGRGGGASCLCVAAIKLTPWHAIAAGGKMAPLA